MENFLIISTIRENMVTNPSGLSDFPPLPCHSLFLLSLSLSFSLPVSKDFITKQPSSSSSSSLVCFRFTNENTNNWELSDAHSLQFDISITFAIKLPR